MFQFYPQTPAPPGAATVARSPQEREARMSGRLQGKRALVTGASRGIGKGLAVYPASEKARWLNGEISRIDGGQW
jgi:hypothetical protein